jgi:hypothetical protein
MAKVERPSRNNYAGWDYVIRSYDAEGRFCVETTHRGQFSRDMEIKAIQRCGRTFRIWTIKSDGSYV